MKKWILALAAAFFTVSESFANPACAVCTVAIGGGLWIAQKLGVDNCVVGIWAGAMLAVLGYWLIRWADKKNWGRESLLRNGFLMALSISSVGFIYVSHLTYDPNVIWFLYIDSFLFSTLVGAAALIAGVHAYAWMKAHNGGHAHFPFEKVVVPFVFVLGVCLLLYYFPVCHCGKATQELPSFF